MFGYIKLDTLAPKELYQNFHKHYCYLCKSIESEYGELARAFLSYDVTVFLILFEEEITFNEVKKFTCVRTDKNMKKSIDNEYVKMCAGMNILFSEGSIRDNIVDSHHLLLMKGASAMYAPVFKKAGKKYPLIKSLIAKGYEVIRELEKKNASIFELEEAFSEIVVKVVTDAFLVTDERKISYARYVGKIIYLLDAIDDIDKDMKSGSFNPFKEYGSKENLIVNNREFVENHFKELLDDVIYIEGDDINTLTYNRIIFDGINESKFEVMKGVVR